MDLRAVFQTTAFRSGDNGGAVVIVVVAVFVTWMCELIKLLLVIILIFY